jgi:hypothetical protein
MWVVKTVPTASVRLTPAIIAKCVCFIETSRAFTALQGIGPLGEDEYASAHISLVVSTEPRLLGGKTLLDFSNERKLYDRTDQQGRSTIGVAVNRDWTQLAPYGKIITQKRFPVNNDSRFYLTISQIV